MFRVKNILLILMSFTIIIFSTYSTALTAPCNVPSVSYSKIQNAIDDPDCDPIIVAAGTYNENITIDRALTLQGAGIDLSIINGQNTGTDISTVKITANGNVTIKGFTINNAPITNAGDLRFAIATNSSTAGVTYTIENNKIVGTNDPAAEEDYGIYGVNGGKENLIIINNTVTKTGANNILIERHTGTTEISNNTLDAGCYGVDAIFIMTHSGTDVTSLQKVHHNTIDLSTGGPFDYNHRATGITFAGAFIGTGKFTNIQITENKIINLKPNRRGIGLWNNSSGDGSGGNITNPIITLNTISGADVVTDSMGIYTYGKVTNATINGNTITGVDYSFKERKHGSHGHIAENTQLNYNSLYNNIKGLETERTSGILNAEYNWWGCSAGPGNTGCDSVTGNVDYDPWLTKRLIPRVDLAVTALTIPTTAAAGASITINETTKNKGSAIAIPSVTAFYLSSDTTLDGSDTKLGSRNIGELKGGESSSGVTTVTIPSGVAGRYYIIAKADDNDLITESNEYNTKARPIKIGPDLVVSVLTIPSTASPGGSINITDITKNNGPGSAVSSNTRFYLSTDTILDDSDTLLGVRSVPALVSGASNAGTTSVTIPESITAGIYYIIAKADADNSVTETKEDNNTKTKMLRIGGDLVIYHLIAPNSASKGDNINITDTTKNKGPAGVGSSTTSFYLSTDAHLDTGPGGDTLLGSRTVPALSSGGTSTSTTTVTIPNTTTPGKYYIIAVADSVNSVTETYENNNIRYRLITVNPWNY